MCLLEGSLYLAHPTHGFPVGDTAHLPTGLENSARCLQNPASAPIPGERGPLLHTWGCLAGISEAKYRWTNDAPLLPQWAPPPASASFRDLLLQALCLSCAPAFKALDQLRQDGMFRVNVLQRNLENEGETNPGLGDLGSSGQGLAQKGTGVWLPLGLALWAGAAWGPAPAYSPPVSADCKSDPGSSTARSPCAEVVPWSLCSSPPFRGQLSSPIPGLTHTYSCTPHSTGAANLPNTIATELTLK